MRSEPPPSKNKTKPSREQEAKKHASPEALQAPQNSHQAFHTLKSGKKPLHQFGTRLLSISQDKAVIKIHKKFRVFNYAPHRPIFNLLGSFINEKGKSPRM